MRMKKILIEFNPATSTIILVIARVFMIVVTTTVFVLGTLDPPYIKKVLPEMKYQSGETTVEIKLQDGKQIAIVRGKGRMTDEYTGLCGYGYSITDLIIEHGVTHIGAGAFDVCRELTSVEIPNSVSSIGRCAFCYSRLSSVNIPNGITSIGELAFSHCYYLTSFTIPNSVTSIGDGAFRSCRMESITIPNNVTFIGAQAFFFCRNLSSIISLNPTPPQIAENTFERINNDACLYVPKESLNAYRNAEFWKDFKCIRDLSSAPTGEGNR